MEERREATPEQELPKHQSMEGLQARLLVGEFDADVPISADNLSNKEKREEGILTTVEALDTLSHAERTAHYAHTTGPLETKVTSWATETAAKIRALPLKYKSKVQEIVIDLVRHNRNLKEEDLNGEVSVKVIKVLYEELFVKSNTPIGLFLDKLTDYYEQDAEKISEDLEIIQWLSGIFGVDSATIISQLLDAGTSVSDAQGDDDVYARLADRSLKNNLDDEEIRLLDLLNRHKKDFTPVLPVRRVKSRRPRDTFPRVEAKLATNGELIETEKYTVESIFGVLNKPVEENKFSIESVPDEFDFEDPDEFIPNKQEVFYTPIPGTDPQVYCPNPRVAPWALELYEHDDRYDEAEMLTDKDSGLLAMCAVATENPEDQALLYVHLARGIVRAHSQQPILREAWEHIQRKDQITSDLLLSFEERREEGLRYVSDQAYKNDSKLYAVPAEIWKDRIARLELLLASPNPQLTRNELRWIEYLSHSVDVYGIFREIEKEGKKQKHFEIEDITVGDPVPEFYLLESDEEETLSPFILTDEEIGRVLRDYPELAISVEGGDTMREKNEKAIRQFMSVLRNPKLLKRQEVSQFNRPIMEHAYGFRLGKSYEEQPESEIPEKGWFFAQTGILSERYGCPAALYIPGNHAYLVLRGPYQNSRGEIEIVYYDPKKQGEQIEKINEMESLSDLENVDKSHVYSNPLWLRNYKQDPNSIDVSISGNDGIPDELKPYFMSGKLGGFQADDIDCIPHCFFMAVVLNALKKGDSDFKTTGIPRIFKDFNIQIGRYEDFFKDEELKQAGGLSHLRERHPSTDNMVNKIEEAVEDAEPGEKVKVTLSNEESGALIQNVVGVEDISSLDIINGRAKIVGIAGSFESEKAAPPVKLESIKFEFTFVSNKGKMKLSEVQVSHASGNKLTPYEKSVMQREIMGQDAHNEFTKYLVNLLEFRDEPESLIEDEILVHIKDDHIELEMTKRGEAKAPPVKQTVGRAPSIQPEAPFTLDPSGDLFEQLKEGLTRKSEIAFDLTVQDVETVIKGTMAQLLPDLQKYNVKGLTIRNLSIDGDKVTFSAQLSAESIQAKVLFKTVELPVKGDLVINLELCTERGTLKVKEAKIDKDQSSYEVKRWNGAYCTAVQVLVMGKGQDLNNDVHKYLSTQQVQVSSSHIDLGDEKMKIKLQR